MWGIAGYETAPTTGTKHIQGYVFLQKKTTLKGIKAFLHDNSVHCEVAKGDHESNRTYCRKSGLYVEWGTFPSNSADDGVRGGELERARWDAIRDACIAGRWEEIPPRILLTHYRTLKCYHADNQNRPKNLDNVCGLWYMGPSGVGKSTKARQVAIERHGNVDDGNAYFTKEADHKWWDGYAGQRCVIIDDVGPQHKHLASLLKIWGDRWSFQAETKGGSTGWIRPELIIVTSQYRITEAFGDVSTANALSRRFKQEEVPRWDGGGSDKRGRGGWVDELGVGDGRSGGRTVGRLDSAESRWDDVGISQNWEDFQENDPFLGYGLNYNLEEET